jgi:serine/threonine protein kinase/tetratricopeptide (TPR) repeat protein
MPIERAAGGDTLDLEGQRALAGVLSRLGAGPVTLRVGRYRIGESLGRGGCGEVFAGHDPELDREVAIKVVLHGRDRLTEAAEARLLREAQALARLAHPNIVQIFDVGIDEIGSGAGARARRGAYIVMERIRGATLGEWITAHAPTPDAIVSAWAEAARGLAAAHGVGVVHRDFKPANAMTTTDGRVVVLDFGLASALDGPASTDPAESSEAARSASSSGRSSGSLTETGIVMGTPRYMAPEQHAAEPATSASDQYAWCVSLWEALCSEPPFHGSDLPSLARAKRAGELRRHPALSPRLYAVLARGLAADPTRRFASMTDLLGALERPSGRRLYLGGGVLGLALALGGAALAIDRTPSLPACTDEIDVGEGRWSDDAIAELKSALSQREDPVDPAAIEPIEARMLRFGADHREATARVCGSLHELPAPVATARGDCLARARDRFDAAIDSIRTRGPHDLPWVSALYALRSPLRCDGPEAEIAFVVAPDDGPEVDALRAHVEGALAARRPRFPGWEGVVEHAVLVADSTGDHFLAAGALALSGRILAQENRYAESADQSSLAAWHAHGAGDTLLAAEILPDAIMSLAAPTAPTAEVDRLIGVAREIAHECGDAPRLHADIDRGECWALEARHDWDAAYTKYRAHIAMLEAQTAPWAPEYLTYALLRLGGLQMRMDQPWAAKQTLERALASMSPAAQKADPMSHADIHAQLSRAAWDSGDLDTAVTAAARALEGFRGDGGTAGMATRALSWYGYVLGSRGQLDEGIAMVTDAIARQRERGPHPMLAELLGQLGFLYELHGDYEAAAQVVEEVRLILADLPTASPRSPVLHHSLMARRLAQAGRAEEAAASLAKAQSAYDTLAAAEGGDPYAEITGGSPIPHAAAWVAAARGDWKTARDSASIALTDPTLHDGTPIARGKLGKLYGLYARALAGDGDEAGARDVADLAVTTMAGAAPGFSRDRAEVERVQADLRAGAGPDPHLASTR